MSGTGVPNNADDGFRGGIDVPYQVTGERIVSGDTTGVFPDSNSYSDWYLNATGKYFDRSSYTSDDTLPKTPPKNMTFADWWLQSVEHTEPQSYQGEFTTGDAPVTRAWNAANQAANDAEKAVVHSVETTLLWIAAFAIVGYGAFLFLEGRR